MCVKPRRPHHPFPTEGRRQPPHSDTPCPSTFSLPPRTLPLPSQRRCTPADHTTHSPSKICSRPPARRHALPQPSCHIPAAQTHIRRLRDAFLAGLTTHSPSQHRRPPPHSDAPFPSTSAPPRSADTRPQAARCIPRRPHNPFPVDPTTHSPSKICSRLRTATRPARALSFPHAARCIPRRPHNTFPTEDRRPSPQRRPASPSVPLRAQKNGTAQWMCDAECLGRPSLRSVIGVGEPRAVRRRCGALAWRVGLRPQPWALRSRRCGRVLRA